MSKSNLKAMQTIEKALKKKQYATPNSPQYKEMRASLLKLQSQHVALTERFASRSARRHAVAEKARNKAIASASEGVRIAQRGLAESKQFSNKALIEMAKNNLLFAERALRMAEEDSIARSLVKNEDWTDSQLLEWYDGFVLVVLQGLSDDVAGDVFLAGVSASLLVLGSIPGPATVVATSIGAAMLAAQVAAITRKGTKQDAEAARLAQVKASIDSAIDISLSWVAILK